MINIPIREVIDDYSRKELLNIMIDAIATVYDVYDNSIYDTENERICLMIDEIDEIVFNAKINYKKQLQIKKINVIIKCLICLIIYVLDLQHFMN